MTAKILYDLQLVLYLQYLYWLPIVCPVGHFVSIDNNVNGDTCNYLPAFINFFKVRCYSAHLHVIPNILKFEKQLLMHLERCFYFHWDIVDPVFSFINHIIFAPVTYTLYHMNHAQYILLLKSLGITEQRPTHTKVLHIIYSIFCNIW